MVDCPQGPSDHCPHGNVWPGFLQTFQEAAVKSGKGHRPWWSTPHSAAPLEVTPLRRQVRSGQIESTCPVGVGSIGLGGRRFVRAGSGWQRATILSTICRREGASDSDLLQAPSVHEGQSPFSSRRGPSSSAAGTSEGRVAAGWRLCQRGAAETSPDHEAWQGRCPHSWSSEEKRIGLIGRF